MNGDEENDKDKKAAAKRYAGRIAEYISRSETWDPQVGNADYANREPNPWHLDFDNTMFWL